MMHQQQIPDYEQTWASYLPTTDEIEQQTDVCDTYELLRLNVLLQAIHAWETENEARRRLQKVQKQTADFDDLMEKSTLRQMLYTAAILLAFLAIPLTGILVHVIH